ncbi:MAG: hypothetical protein Q7Q71_05310 [Verrucomicrobiota bacterium JB023]|nr:hypothetical protein [Verrucomicrobiota bacterium JB023]
MNVALVHYHLRTGGVSRVIKSQSAALTRAGIDHLVLSAGPLDDEIPGAIIPGLDYSREAFLPSRNLYQQLLSCCEMHFGGPPDLWHFHNPTLGKSVHYPEIVAALAKEDAPLILQLHDLAEDNRPENYSLLKDDLTYPIAPQIHYAFINQRDRRLLTEAGVENAHLLPNEVSLPSMGQALQRDGENLVFYPVRAIRRKNIGEVLLLAALAPAQTTFAIALAPENPEWRKVHQDWVELARKLELPVHFDVVDRLAPAQGAAKDYASWLSHASHLVSTSIAEGFGMTFLEPALIGKPLLGRDLPEITSDFSSNGIQPGRLYQAIPVPINRLDLPELRRQWVTGLATAFQSYGQPLSPEACEEAWQKFIADDVVDFGELPESFQAQLISQASEDASLFHELRQWLEQTLAEKEPTAFPSQLESHTPAANEERLLALYDQARSSVPAPPTWLSGKKILAQYLKPSRFHFLRS